MSIHQWILTLLACALACSAGWYAYMGNVLTADWLAFLFVGAAFGAACPE